MRDERCSQARHRPSHFGSSVRREENVRFRNAGPGRLDARRSNPHGMAPAVARAAEKNVDEVHVPRGTDRVYEDFGRRAVPFDFDRLGEAPLRDAEAVLDMRPRDPADETRHVEQGRHADEAQDGCRPRPPVARRERLHESGGSERREREDEGRRERDPARVRAFRVAREETARKKDRDREKAEPLDAVTCHPGRGPDDEESAHTREDDRPVGIAVAGKDVPAHEEKRRIVAHVREERPLRFPRGTGKDREIPHVGRQALRVPRIRDCQGRDDGDFREKCDERQAADDAWSLTHATTKRAAGSTRESRAEG